MRIVLDAMGSDTHPEPELQAAVEASRHFGEPIILVGPADLLEPRLIALGGEQVHLVHAPEVLEMTDKPAVNARRKELDEAKLRWQKAEAAREQLADARRQRRMEKAIRQMRDHYIVCGCGRTGAPAGRTPGRLGSWPCSTFRRRHRRLSRRRRMACSLSRRPALRART